jgi:thiamine pyrophosphate-dependent acetolactate synthase large subunit-like protein
MLRLDCLRAIYSDLEKCLVVTIMGALPAELQSLGHRPNFFYLQHAMGLASSTGLGLALSLPHQKVAVLDGDGSLLMNLGSLSTLARYKPKNLVHIVFDNESLLCRRIPHRHEHRHRSRRHRSRRRHSADLHRPHRRGIHNCCPSRYLG